MILSMVLVIWSTVYTAIRRDQGKRIIKPIFAVQVLEGAVDATFLFEVATRMFLLKSLFWKTWFGPVDVAIALSCIGTFMLYNFYPHRTNYDADAERADNVIYIIRQIVRFIRSLYFFLWFSESLVEFRLHNASSSGREDDVDRSPFVASLSEPSSRMASPFVSPYGVQSVPSHENKDDDFTLDSPHYLSDVVHSIRNSRNTVRRRAREDDDGYSSSSSAPPLLNERTPLMTTIPSDRSRVENTRIASFRDGEDGRYKYT